MNGSYFERCVVEAIQEMATNNGWKQKPLAESAWTDRKDAGTKWRKIRNGTEPRGLRVCDAFDLADAMGESFLDVCALALSKMRENLKTQQTKKETASPDFIEIPHQIAEAASTPGTRRQNSAEP